AKQAKAHRLAKNSFFIVDRYLSFSYIFPPRTAPIPSRIGHKANILRIFFLPVYRNLYPMNEF
ncbi:MAG: hypothetical protein KA237_05935, partial [Alistipes sp.]|nr:hypothetical protein [Alistipes sp.]